MIPCSTNLKELLFDTTKMSIVHFALRIIPNKNSIPNILNIIDCSIIFGIDHYFIMRAFNYTTLKNLFRIFLYDSCSGDD